MLHTHWDREWYESAATYRVRLTQVLGDILTRLEKGALPAFTLDGQTALIDDYCSVYPEAYGRISALVKAGKLHIGPWFTAPDSWLVGGESLLRNLHWGMQQATNMGEKSFTGYLPDTFGHPADIPALLRHMGLNTAIVWRGVAKAQHNPFVWQGDDMDASVLTYHLREGYFHPFLHDPTLTDDEKAEQFGAMINTLSGDDPLPLVPIGGDHLGAIPEAGFQLLKTLMPQLSVVSPAQYMALLAKHTGNKATPTVSGALMDNTDAYLLTGVWSSRPGLKQANRRCQHKLVNQLEPLLVWAKQQHLAPTNWPDWHRLWQQAWRTLLLNHPHDSICGCSTDEVHRQNHSRFEDVTDIATALITRIERAALNAFNPSPSTANEDTDERPELPVGVVLLNPSATALQNNVIPITATGTTAINQLANNPAVQWAQQRTILADGYKTDPNQIPLSHVTVPQRTGWLWVAKAPRSSVQPVEASTLPPCSQPVQAAMVAQAARLVGPNGSCHVTPSQTGMRISSPYGGWTVRFTWQEDAGDSYTRCPVAGSSIAVAECISVSLVQQGPLVASCQSVWHWPTMPQAGEFTVTSKLTAGSPVVEITADWPTPLPSGLWQCQVNTHRPVTQLFTESHIGVNHTDINPAADWRHQLPVEPFKEALPQSAAMQRFAVANGCLLLSDGPPEVEAIDSTLNVSLLRTFSHISNGAMASRGGAAGPPVQTPQAQHTNQPVSVRLGVGSIPQEKVANRAWVPWAMAQAQRFDGAAWAIARSVDKTSEPSGSTALPMTARLPIAQWDNPAVVRLACKPTEDGDGWLLRLVNITDTPQKAMVQCGQAVDKVWHSNGLEDTTEQLTLNTAETFTVSLRPYQLMAIRFNWLPQNTPAKKLRIKT